MFLAISLLVSETDLSNLVSKLKFILSKENKEEEFQATLNELIKLKILELENKDFFKVYSSEIFRLMKKYYQNKGDEYDGSITSRFNLINNNRKLDTEFALLEDADSSRIISTEEEVENKYRYILNRDKSPFEVKLKALINYGSYLISYKSKLDKALKLYDDYNHIFNNNKDFILIYSRSCWSEGSEERKALSIQILQTFLAKRPQIAEADYLEILGTLMTYKSVMAVADREDLKEKYRFKGISKLNYLKAYQAQKERFLEIYHHPGLRLYNFIKDRDLMEMKANIRNHVLDGLTHFVEICIRLNKVELAKEICQLVIRNVPQDFHKAFESKLSKIGRIDEQDKLKHNKNESDLGIKLKEALSKK